MRSSQSRRCTLLDVMALIAATAIGFSLARTYSLEVLSNDLKHYPFLPRVLLTSWAYILAVLPVPAMWSIALFGLSLRRPRPDLRQFAASRDSSPPGLLHWSARSDWPAS